MKRKTNLMAGIATLALSVAACAAFGQDPGNEPPPPPPPVPPVIRALDTNHDGIIDADEIANAPQSLRTLIKSGSTQLTIPDLLGPPRHGRHPRGQGQGQGQGQGNAGGQQGGPNGPSGPGAPDSTGTSGAQGNDQGGPPGRHRPLPPVIKALDTNHDGIVDENEIANAAQSLKTLLKSGSTELSIPDLLGPPPRGPRQAGQGNDQNCPPPDGNGPGGPPPPAQSGTDGQNNPPPPPPE